MGKDPIKVTEDIVSCSDNGQHPLVYICLKDGSGRCQYCGQLFVHQIVAEGDLKEDLKAA